MNSDRFKDVPIYIRAGKRLAQTATEISVVFKVPELRLMKHLQLGMEPNVLTYRIQPNEGVQFKILIKKPGHEVELESSTMRFCYNSVQLPEPYEHVLYDAIRGEQTFFNNAEEVEAQWAFIDPLIAQRKTPEPYTDDSWGPQSADALIRNDGRTWIIPEENFCAMPISLSNS